MQLINVIKKEYAEGDFAISDCKVTFLCIPVYRIKVTTTNKQIKDALSIDNRCFTTINVKGFNDEDTNKKNQQEC